MVVTRRKRIIIATVVYLGSFGQVLGNTGIPGPIIWAASALTVSPWQWVAATMFMCVGVEAAIYKYLSLFKRPLLASFIANIISLVLGVPLMFVGAIDPTYVVLPTIISIISEATVLQYLPECIGISKTYPVKRVKLWWSVIFANVVTNAVMIGYLYWVMTRG